VDMFSECEPDELHDLEKIPWPWETDSVNEIVFNHSLEHIGADSRIFLKMIQELYRVCEKDCLIRINVPHPRHNNFINDPTHVRIITPELLLLFSKRMNEEWKHMHAANSPLALYLNVDFELVSVQHILDEPYLSMFNNKQITVEELSRALKDKNNVASEYRIVMKAIK
jgi:hypothetical protein